MPKIINKRANRFVTLDRELMADTRLKPMSKLLYALLCGLSESCDNVFPSYKWLAEQIGYDTKGKSERTLGMFMIRQLKPLISLDMIRVVNNPGYANDFEIYEYTPVKNQEKTNPNPEQKCAESPNKNVQTPPHKNVTPYNIEKEEYRNKSERVKKTTQIFQKILDKKTNTLQLPSKIWNYHQTLFPELSTEEVCSLAGLFLLDYPNAKLTTLISFLSERRLKKQPKDEKQKIRKSDSVTINYHDFTSRDEYEDAIDLAYKTGQKVVINYLPYDVDEYWNNGNKWPDKSQNKNNFRDKHKTTIKYPFLESKIIN